MITQPSDLLVLVLHRLRWQKCAGTLASKTTSAIPARSRSASPDARNGSSSPLRRGKWSPPGLISNSSSPNSASRCRRAHQLLLVRTWDRNRRDSDCVRPRSDETRNNTLRRSTRRHNIAERRASRQRLQAAPIRMGAQTAESPTASRRKTLKTTLRA